MHARHATPRHAHARAQVKEGSYDFEANKTLLKLYLLFPSLANQEKVEMVRTYCVSSQGRVARGLSYVDTAGQPSSHEGACIHRPLTSFFLYTPQTTLDPAQGAPEPACHGLDAPALHPPGKAADGRACVPF